MLDEFGQVVEEPPEAGGVSPIFFVQTRTTTIQKTNGKSCPAQESATLLIPPAVTLNAVNTNYPRLCRRWRHKTAILPRVAVAGLMLFNRVVSNLIRQLFLP